MANLLISFFSNMIGVDGQQIIPAFYESFIDGLQINGHKLLILRHSRFGQDLGELSDPHLESLIRYFAPDMAIIFNNSFFDLSRKFSFPIIVYDVDSPRYFSNIHFIKENPSRYKFITSQSSSVSMLHKAYSISKNDILLAPFFTSIINEDLPKKNNICFVGTRFPTRGRHGLTPWNSFMAGAPNLYQKKEFLNIVKRIQLLPGEERKIIESSHLPLSAKRLLIDEMDMVMNLSGSKRELILSQISDLGLVIHGQKEWILDSVADVDLALAYDPTPVISVRDNQNLYNSSRLGININHVQADSGFSWRVLDIMASSACLVSEQNTRLRELFPHISIPLFKDRFDARGVCKELLNDEKSRHEIIAQCNKAIDEKFRLSHVLVQISDFLGIELIEKINCTKYQPQIFHLD